MKHRNGVHDLAAKVEGWTAEQIEAWITGVCPSIPSSSIHIQSGKHLILVDADDLAEIKAFGKRKTIVQALGLLKYFCYEAPRENLETLCAALSAACEQTRRDMLSVQAQRQSATKRAQIVAILNSILSTVSYMVEHAKKLIFWLDRSPFVDIQEYVELRQRVVAYTKEIADFVNDKNPANVFGRANYIAEKIGELGEVCEWVCTACDDPLIVSTSYLVETKITRKEATVPWGIDLQSSYLGVHVVSEVRVDTPADGGKIDAGDELVMVDQHTVIGWDLKSVAATLAAPSLSLVLLVRKRPMDSPSILPKGANPPKKTVRPLRLAPGSLRPTVDLTEESKKEEQLQMLQSPVIKVPEKQLSSGTLNRRRSSTFVQNLIGMALSRTKRRASLGTMTTAKEEPTSLERPTHLTYDLLSVDTQGPHVVQRTRTMRHQANGYTRSFIDNKVVRDSNDEEDQLTYNVPCPREFSEITVAATGDLKQMGISTDSTKTSDPEWAAPIQYALRPFRMVQDSGMSSASHESGHATWDESSIVAQSPSAWSVRSSGSPLCVVSDTDIIDSGRAFEGWIRRRKTTDELRDAATNKWPKCWMRLAGSHLHLSENQNAKKPSFVFCLSECTVSSAPALKTSKKFVFAVSRANFHFYFSCYSQSDLKSWVQKISGARHLACERAECLLRGAVHGAAAVSAATTPRAGTAPPQGAAGSLLNPPGASGAPTVTLDAPTPCTPPDTPQSGNP
ncbi:hypothetical protein PFISCL1PPCAC_11489 [Pristionchus fissidentatus]|uniref:Cnk-1 n=1 Tax=Pristionchus fissidentatus TaxID=1538716 RepID=A0AAV5VNC5_9BILA|nr:hypothetical protein PFISCL1PPCAC_11489 [Pristionchus fissidentatus]